MHQKKDLLEQKMIWLKSKESKLKEQSKILKYFNLENASEEESKHVWETIEEAMIFHLEGFFLVLRILGS